MHACRQILITAHITGRSTHEGAPGCGFQLAEVTPMSVSWLLAINGHGLGVVQHTGFPCILAARCSTMVADPRSS